MSISPDPLGSKGETRIIGKGSATAEGPGPYVMAASTLEGDKVMCSDGEEVGKIKEIMLDVYTGRIAYAVMSVGGFLGIGDKLLAIPWNALTLDTDRKCFQLSVSSDTVKNAPGFDKDHWPAMADVALGERAARLLRQRAILGHGRAHGDHRRGLGLDAA